MIIVTSYETNYEDSNVTCHVSDTNMWQPYTRVVSFATLREYVKREYGTSLELYLANEDHASMCVDLSCIVRGNKPIVFVKSNVPRFRDSDEAYEVAGQR